MSSIRRFLSVSTARGPAASIRHAAALPPRQSACLARRAAKTCRNQRVAAIGSAVRRPRRYPDRADPAEPSLFLSRLERACVGFAAK
jgi:hypothetical protein